MTAEDQVLRDVQSLLAGSQLTDRLQLLVGRWVENGLPSQPVEGPAGRDQLRHAGALLRETATDVAAVAALAIEFPGQRVVFVADSTDATGDAAREGEEGFIESPDAVLEWSSLLIRVADTLDDFVRTQADGDRR